MQSSELQTLVLTCESEPIHIPAAIQSHGLFFALVEPQLEIATVSANARDALGLGSEVTLLGQRLDELLTSASSQILRQALAKEPLEAANPLSLALAPRGSSQAEELRFDGILHRSQNLLILELEPAHSTDAPSFFGFYHAVQQAMFRLEIASSFETATQIAAEEVAKLTGFGRVMVYQFDRDWHGWVRAEYLRPEWGMESFLGLHFPQSDIPAQARRLYSLNSLRLIADVNYQAVSLEPDHHPFTREPLDLSLANLRSVSPVHLAYLRNMQVAASMSISVMKEGQLWGLIACHHPTAHYVSFQLRSACRFIGQLLSQQLHTLEAKQVFEDRARVRTRLNAIRPAFEARKASEIFPAIAEELLELLAAQGVAFYLQNRWHCAGSTPHVEELDALLAWLHTLTPASLFSSHHLAKDYSPARDFAMRASGLLAVPLSKGGGHLLWFRPEVVQTVYWAGEPRKDPGDGALRLSPRRSFASWKEIQRQRALPWTQAEIEAALDLRDLVMSHEIERLNVELQRSNAELDSFASIASHDLREPLRGMRSYAQFIVEDEGAALAESSRTRLETIKKLGERSELLVEGLYQYSRLGRVALAQRDTDLNELLDEVSLRLEVFFAERGVRLLREQRLPRLCCDRLRLGEVYYNLLLNAAKYNDKADKWIKVGWQEAKNQGLILFVADNGIGIAEAQQQRVFAIFKRGPGSEKFGAGTGTGLTMARRIIETHGGRMWLESTPGQGTTFYWTLGSQWEKPEPEESPPSA